MTQKPDNPAQNAQARAKIESMKLETIPLMAKAGSECGVGNDVPATATAWAPPKELNKEGLVYNESI